MQRFADLIDRLTFTPSRNGKLRLIETYMRETPDPDRGWALAALTGSLDVKAVKPALLRALMAEQMDEILFRYSYDFVGDLAETIALLWPTPEAVELVPDHSPSLSEVVDALTEASRSTAPKLVADLLNQMPTSARYVLIKMVTGALRIGVSGRLTRQALANLGGKAVEDVEEIWHGLTPPYTNLFAWLEARAERPAARAATPFRPVMLAHPLDEADLATLNVNDFTAEWKWDGIRVQAVCEGKERRLYSRTGDDISAAFPDVVDHLDFNGAIDGELLVARPGTESIDIASFGDLQQRLNRKTVTKPMLQSHPAFIRAYDLMHVDGQDLRALPFVERRQALEQLAAKLEPTRFDISPLLNFSTWDELAALRADPPHAVIEGVMLKRKDSPYLAGRVKGPWYKWKRDPRVIDAVLIYAQRGHGKRSGYYSDYTFAVWTDSGELTPVGKAYFGFTDEELRKIDSYIRNNTVERFGPVRRIRAEPDHGLVFEVAFEGLNRSTRHKSGVAMRFPRISRLRFDKLPKDADRLETLEKMLEP